MDAGKEAERKARKVAARRKWREENPDKQRAIAREQSRKYRALNREKVNQYTRELRAKDPEKTRAIQRASHYRRLYGITQGERDALLIAQGNCCAICNATEPGSRNWHVDHCHDTGVVRGILCHHCNLGLGHAKDDIEILRKMIAYLEARKC